MHLEIVSPEALASGIDESAVKIICPDVFLDFAITVTGLSPEETPGIGPEPGRVPTSNWITSILPP